MDPTAVALMQLYVPLPNQPGNNFQSVPNQIVNGDQGSVKFDYRLTNNQNLNVYYYVNDSLTNQAFSFFQAAGANVPGFGAAVPTTVQQLNIAHIWTISNSLVNEARFTYMRENQIGFRRPRAPTSCKTRAEALFPAASASVIPTIPALELLPAWARTTKECPSS